jgi:predicted nuclease of restriction endonuclease-like (RecB) superfamily
LFYSQENTIFHQVGGKLENAILSQVGEKLQRHESKANTFPQQLVVETRSLIPHQLGAEIQHAKNKENIIRPQVGDELGTHPIFQIPWRHHVEIFTKCKSTHEALFYVQKTIKNGWNRAVLMNFIETDLYNRQGKAITNFDRLLPDVQSDLAKEVLKDPYNFDLMGLTENYKEKELEDALVANITKFLLELGQGFAYVGRQYPIKVGNKERNIDLLFYHLELRCYVVIELKAREFEPEHTGKLGYYISAVNNQLKKDIDNPTIGMLIVKHKNNIDAQYSLESSSQPIGISEYQLSKLLPENFKSSLPSIEEIEQELNKE